MGLDFVRLHRRAWVGVRCMWLVMRFRRVFPSPHDEGVDSKFVIKTRFAVAVSKIVRIIVYLWQWHYNAVLNEAKEINAKQVEQSSDNRCVLANCPRTCLFIVFQIAYFLIPDVILFQFGPFLGNSTRVWRTDRPTDGRTDRRTDGRTNGHTLL